LLKKTGNKVNMYVLIAQGIASYLSACKGITGYSKIMNYGAVRVAIVPLQERP